MNDDIGERMASLETALRDNTKTTWRVFEALYGNGKPGLIAEFQALRQSVEAHHAGHRERRTDWKWLVTTIVAIGAVAAAVLK